MGKSIGAPLPPRMPPATREQAPAYSFGPRDGFGYEVAKIQTETRYVHRGGSSSSGYGFGTGFMFGLMID